jgi:hypothetical protein
VPDDLSVGRCPDVLAPGGGDHQVEAIPIRRRGGAGEDPPFDLDLVPLAFGVSGFHLGTGGKRHQRSAIRLLSEPGVGGEFALFLGVEQRRRQQGNHRCAGW